MALLCYSRAAGIHKAAAAAAALHNDKESLVIPPRPSRAFLRVPQVLLQFIIGFTLYTTGSAVRGSLSRIQVQHAEMCVCVCVYSWVGGHTH